MNKDQVLQLQAWVDGELSASEARRVAEWVRGSLEAQAVVEELRATQSLLAANEPEVCLPAAESPEFYWNKIQRAIAREEAVSAMTQARSGLPWLLAWRRVLAPASGLALVAFLSVLSLN